MRGDLTATLPAGATLARGQRACWRASGQWLPLDPPLADRATIGGIVATNDSGPRRHRYGAPRDLIIGIEIALADGRVAKAGGRVVKNVAGYDLARLLCGSFGSLGRHHERDLQAGAAAAGLAHASSSRRSDAAAARRRSRSRWPSQPLTPSAVELAAPHATPAGPVRNDRRRRRAQVGARRSAARSQARDEVGTRRRATPSATLWQSARRRRRRRDGGTRREGRGPADRRSPTIARRTSSGSRGQPGSSGRGRARGARRASACACDGDPTTRKPASVDGAARGRRADACGSARGAASATACDAAASIRWGDYRAARCR